MKENQGNEVVAVDEVESVVDEATKLTAILVREAERLVAAGKRVIPCFDKKPMIENWNGDGANPTIEHIKYWMSSDAFNGIGVVQGSVSGGEHTLDFERIDVFDAFKAEVILQGVPIPQPLCLIKTGKGYHLPFSCRDLKVGTRPLLAGDEDCKPLIELLGEKCFAVRAPSSHPSGTIYQVIHGDQCNLPILTLDEANQLGSVGKLICLPVSSNVG